MKLLVDLANKWVDGMREGKQDGEGNSRWRTLRYFACIYYQVITIKIPETS